jgi:hypothetical protein
MERPIGYGDSGYGSVHALNPFYTDKRAITMRINFILSIGKSSSMEARRKKGNYKVDDS